MTVGFDHAKHVYLNIRKRKRRRRKRGVGSEKGNKMTVSECGAICVLTATYICKPGKSENIQPRMTQFAAFCFFFYTHGHFTHCDVCYKEQ